MKGTKAEALDRWAERQGRACLRFDYSGHGESGGDFNDGTIGRWLEESVAVYTQFAQGPQVVIGSSMGGWLALLLAPSLRKRKGAAPIAGMVLIAPAVDFTEELMWKQFPDAIKREIEDKGRLDAAVGIFRGALSDHQAVDRGRPQASPARRPDRDRLPGAHPARRAGPGRAVAARGRAGVALCPRRRGAHPDQGRRPPAVAAGGHRAADRGGEGVSKSFRDCPAHSSFTDASIAAAHLSLDRRIVRRFALRQRGKIFTRQQSAERPHRGAAHQRRGIVEQSLGFAAPARHRRNCRWRSAHCARSGRGRCA